MLSILDKIKKSYIDKILFWLMLFILFAINIFIWGKLGFFCALTSDNLSFSLYELAQKPFESLLSLHRRHGGGLLAYFLTQFLSSDLSKLFNIHVADFIGTPLGLIKGFLFSLMLFTFANYSQLFYKAKLLLLYLLTFFGLFSYYSIFSGHAEVLLFDNNMFFRFLFPLIFYPIYYMLIYKTIINNKLSKKLKCPLLLFLVFNIVLATHVEIIAIQTIIFYSMLLGYNLLTKLYVEIKSNKKIKGVLYNLNTTFYISFVTFTAFFVGFMFFPGSVKIYKTRISYNIDIHSFIENFISNCINSNLIFYILFISFLIFAIIVSFKRKEVNKIIFILFIHLSLLFSMFTLMFAQNEGTIYVLDVRLSYMYKFLLLYTVFLLISYIIKHIKYKEIFLNALYILLIFSFSFFIYNLQKNFELYKEHSNAYYLEKVKIYIQDKMFRYYNLKGERPHLDSTFLHYTNEDCNLFSPEILTDDATVFNNSSIWEYYKQLYKIVPEEYTRYSNTAIDEFYNNGGYFTKEEIKNIKYQNLYSKEHIFNAKGEKMSAEDIKEIMITPVVK